VKRKQQKDKGRHETSSTADRPPKDSQPAAEVRKKETPAVSYPQSVRAVEAKPNPLPQPSNLVESVVVRHKVVPPAPVGGEAVAAIPRPNKVPESLVAANKPNTQPQANR
jgi:hypothetical protein